ncbi:hypothetical protein WMF30_48375 [Sorangium sp. So ce134]
MEQVSGWLGPVHLEHPRHEPRVDVRGQEVPIAARPDEQLQRLADALLRAREAEQTGPASAVLRGRARLGVGGLPRVAQLPEHARVHDEATSRAGTVARGTVARAQPRVPGPRHASSATSAR